jgi:ABC-type uncharacterized transport system auxiliary subunit
MIYWLMILASSFGIAACSGMLDSDAPAERVYWLEPLIMQQTGVADVALPSLALSVGAAPGLDTDRLLILGPGARLNYYASARWPGDIREVFESLLRTTLESTGRYSRVTAGPASRSTDWVLELEVRELYTLAKASETADMVRIVLSGYVSCPESDHAILTQAAIGIEDNQLSKIVDAYQRAFHEVSRQLVTRLAETCNVTNLSAN